MTLLTHDPWTSASFQLVMDSIASMTEAGKLVKAILPEEELPDFQNPGEDASHLMTVLPGVKTKEEPQEQTGDTLADVMQPPSPVDPFAEVEAAQKAAAAERAAAAEKESAEKAIAVLVKSTVSGLLGPQGL